MLQVVLNVLMTVSFGMYLAFYHEYSIKKVTTYTFLLSLFIEITQLTGIFSIYSGSYRLCDVGDLKRCQKYIIIKWQNYIGLDKS